MEVSEGAAFVYQQTRCVAVPWVEPGSPPGSHFRLAMSETSGRGLCF
jgi:hypothetical protein